MAATLIFAGSGREARDYIEEIGGDPDDYSVVSVRAQVRALYDPDIVVLEGFVTHPHYESIREAINARLVRYGRPTI